MVNLISDNELIIKALACRENAYAPYSQFLVGAAVLFDSGNVYTGCNVENSSFGAANCAERTAIFAGAAAGEIKDNHRIVKVAVVGGKVGADLDFCPPCGICLQVISEFAADSQDCEIILAKVKSENGRQIIADSKKYSLSQLLPMGFALSE